MWQLLAALKLPARPLTTNFTGTIYRAIARPELVLATNFSNSTQTAVEGATRLKALLGPQTSVFAYQSMWVRCYCPLGVRARTASCEVFESAVLIFSRWLPLFAGTLH
jgi:hypothetical protein